MRQTVHIFDLCRYCRLRTYCREAHEMDGFDLSPEGRDLDRQESEGLSSLLIIFRMTLEKLTV
jgi:hypothetical protein